MDDFVEVYATTTGRKQRVPRHFLEDPVLSVGIRKTPSQRELDGDLPNRPTQDSTVKEIDKYADVAGINLAADADKTAKLTAVEAVFEHADVQAGLTPVEPEQPPADPLAPELVAAVDPQPAAQLIQQTSDDTVPSDETPAAGDEEN